MILGILFPFLILSDNNNRYKFLDGKSVVFLQTTILSYLKSPKSITSLIINGVTLNWMVIFHTC